mmetsp:Transcript_31032/g.52516  ORF Transcript_31032/g.52516 Transcript_31032/m.52516 type:complete len:120 (+) Transcript_31032:825-1184(+)
MINLMGRKVNRIAGIVIMSRSAPMILGNAVTMKTPMIATTMIDEREGEGDGTTVEIHRGAGEGIGAVTVIGVEEIDRLIHAGVATDLEAVVAKEDEEDRDVFSLSLSLSLSFSLCCCCR